MTRWLMVAAVVLAACGKGSSSEAPPKPAERAKPPLTVKVRPRGTIARLEVTTMPGGKLKAFRKADIKNNQIADQDAKTAVADANGKATFELFSLNEGLRGETEAIVSVTDPAPLAPGQNWPAEAEVQVKWSADDPVAPFTIERPAGAAGTEVHLFGKLTNSGDTAYPCKLTATNCGAAVTPDGKVSFDLVDATAKTASVDGKPATIAGGRAHIELDLGGRIAGAELVVAQGHLAVLPIAVELTDEEGTWKGTFDLDARHAAEVMLQLDRAGPVALPGDPAAPTRPMTGVLLAPMGSGHVITSWVGPGKRAIDIDVLLTVGDGARRTLGSCKYEGGRTVVREGADQVVTARDRRTGKQLTAHTVSARPAECSQYVLASGPAVTKLSAQVTHKDVEAWARKWLGN